MTGFQSKRAQAQDKLKEQGMKKVIVRTELMQELEVPKDEVEAFKAATENMCTFYGRDRGETGQEFKVFPTLKKAESYFEGSWCEYLYVYKYKKSDDYQSGEWHYKKAGERWKKLAPAIAKLDPKECAE